ncbi:MAG: hypothetical protein VXY77_00070 [Pseudomonadota bacterium]|nr:hypothetical protein [Pseudomonadota bacterium]
MNRFVALLLCVIYVCCLGSQAHQPNHYQILVRDGDTLQGIARTMAEDGPLTEAQWMVIIWQHNLSQFDEGNITALKIGSQLIIPSKQVLAHEPTNDYAIDLIASHQKIWQQKHAHSATPSSSQQVQGIQPSSIPSGTQPPQHRQADSSRSHQDSDIQDQTTASPDPHIVSTSPETQPPQHRQAQPTAAPSPSHQDSDIQDQTTVSPNPHIVSTSPETQPPQHRQAQPTAAPSPSHQYSGIQDQTTVSPNPHIASVSNTQIETSSDSPSHTHPALSEDHKTLEGLPPVNHDASTSSQDIHKIEKPRADMTPTKHIASKDVVANIQVRPHRLDQVEALQASNSSGETDTDPSYLGAQYPKVKPHVPTPEALSGPQETSLEYTKLTSIAQKIRHLDVSWPVLTQQQVKQSAPVVLITSGITLLLLAFRFMAQGYQSKRRESFTAPSETPQGPSQTQQQLMRVEELYATTDHADFDVFSTHDGQFVKLNLAKAYVKMNDSHAARLILESLLACPHMCSRETLAEAERLYKQV